MIESKKTSITPVWGYPPGWVRCTDHHAVEVSPGVFAVKWSFEVAEPTWPGLRDRMEAGDCDD
jgi:hypothetical protein